MATHTTSASFVRKIRATGQAINRGQRDTLMAAAMIMKDHLHDEIARDVGGDMKMRNVGSIKTRGAGGAKLGARFDVKGTSNPTALFKPTGPVALNEFGAKAHVIQGRRVGRGQRRRVALPDGGVRRSVAHPGTKGKGGWKRGREKGTKPAVDRMRKSMIDIVKRGAVG